MSRIERTIEIGAPLEEVFNFFTDIRNHGRITPPKTAERLVDHGDIPLRKGSIVTLRARYGGVYWNLSSRITDYVPPSSQQSGHGYFRDEQVRGPFAFWKHEHIFIGLSDNATGLTDRFDFAAPFGVLGRIVERIWLDREMRGLMIHLQDTAKRLIEVE